MTHIYRARVADTSLTTGTGPISVSGVPPELDLQTFSAIPGIQYGDTFYCGVANRSTGEWEEGLYTYVGINTLARAQIYQSSNNDNPVNFSAGVKDVWLTTPSITAKKADENANITGIGQIDFGPWPGAPEASLVISAQAGIVAGSMVRAGVMATATVDHSADEHWIDPPLITAGGIVPGSGFIIYATSQSSFRLYGKYTVSWWWK